MSKVLLGVGTNVGDRQANINQALEAIQAQFVLIDRSSLYESKPVYVEEQPYFLNLACQIETELSPHQLLVRLKQIESQLGRTPTFRYGPRLIDLDILFYDDLVMEVPDLTIPHPRLSERAFVLIPLMDIAPELLHPRCHLTIRDLCLRLGDVQDQIWIFSENSSI